MPSKKNRKKKGQATEAVQAVPAPTEQVSTTDAAAEPEPEPEQPVPVVDKKSAAPAAAEAAPTAAAGESSSNKKKKKKKKKKKESELDQAALDEATEVLQLATQTTGTKEKTLTAKQMREIMHKRERRVKGSAEKPTEDFKFWKTQPVTALEDEPKANGPIEVKQVSDVMQKPYPLPSAFEWESVDVTDPKLMDEVYTLLTENYVEDDDNMFRFDYSRDFLTWALMPPGYFPDWHVGVRAKTGNKKLLGFITGVPVEIAAHGKPVRMCEINFLCVHKKLRSKRLTPVLIKEVTRRVNLKNIWQAVYTAGVVLPKPVASNRYWHRSLNPKKLISIGFSRLQPKLTMSSHIKLYRVPTKPLTPGIREMEERDVSEACALLNKFLENYQLHQVYDEDEFRHWLFPRENVVNSFVVEDPETKKITDMVSFYNLPSTIIGNKDYNLLKAAYSFYNVSTKTPWNQLMTDSLIFAKQRGFDVMNALDVMENSQFLKPLKFGIGDGHLQYYLYNWQCPSLEPGQVGLVLL